MTICTKCAEVADKNRQAHDVNGEELMYEYPSNCGCPCMKKKTRAWEEMYIHERPHHETKDS